MKVPDFNLMGPTGFYSPTERAVLAGVAWNGFGEWEDVPAGGTRYIAYEVLDDFAMVVWSVTVGMIAGHVGNKPYITELISGELEGGTEAPANAMMTSQPPQTGFKIETGDTLKDGAVIILRRAHDLGGRNILNGIRVLGPGIKMALGIQNKDAAKTDLMTVGVYSAIYPVTEAEFPY